MADAGSLSSFNLETLLVVGGSSLPILAPSARKVLAHGIVLFSALRFFLSLHQQICVLDPVALCSAIGVFRLIVDSPASRSHLFLLRENL